MSDFVHLHVHSYYSQLDGLSTLNGLIDKAVADGMPALALTDHGNMFGVKEFYNAINKYNGKVRKGLKEAKAELDKATAEGDAEAVEAARQAYDKAAAKKTLKPILGCEMYVASKSLHDREDRGRHLIVLAKNEKGYHNLIKLVSQAWTEGFHYNPRTDKAALAAHREGLIVCSACLGGEIPQLLMAGDYEAADKAVAWWKDTFGDDYYLELQRHRIPGHPLRDASDPDAETFDRQHAIEPHLIALARKYGIGLVATNDSHFVNADDAATHKRLICISTNKTIDEMNASRKMVYTGQEWLKSTAEMSELFADIPEAIETSVSIADKVEEYSIDHAPIMPNFEIPADFGSEAEYRSRITEQELFDEFTRDENGNVVMDEEAANKKIKALGGYDKLYRIKFEADYLTKLAFEGARKRYGEKLPEDVVSRIRFELHIMKTMGFPGYFLIVQDFIQEGRKMGVSIGPGRGSAAGSVVAYCLGITQLDPLKYDLLFERFLNPDRISLPDIDIDFDDDGREVVLNYVTRRYGAPNVAHIITYGTMAAKTSIKDMARIMSYSPDRANFLTKLIPDHMPPDPKKPDKELKPTVANCMAYVDDFKKVMEDNTAREILTYASKLEGTVRNTGVHACGVIICRDDVTDWVPVSTATDKNGDRILVTQYEGKVIEETGLIKMDFLGLTNLSIIREAVDTIKRTRGIDVDMDNIPLDDARTYELFSRGATVGTFQFESPGMQRYLRELKPSCFEDLIAMNALYRPGPMEKIPEFIERKHGRAPIVYDIPEMEQYLKDTYGITVYQEQVMLLSRLLGGLTRGQSDTLRKAMGKKLIEKMNELKGIFMKGGTERGHDPAVLEKIWKEWEKFASYAFNKSHATCYSWVAYQTGYLKANYPAEYMAAVLSRNLDNTSTLVQYMDECKAMGLKVKGPDVNHSDVAFGVDSNGDIRFGLSAIKGIGVEVSRRIVETRSEGGPFKDIYDFVERVPSAVINRRVFDGLVLAGAFDCFEGTHREDLVAEIGKRGETAGEILIRYGNQYQLEQNRATASLFGFDDEDMRQSARPVLPHAPEWTVLARLEKERELVGMFLSAHPLDNYWLEVTQGADFTAAQKNEMHEVSSAFTMAGVIMEITNRTLQSGSVMSIVKIEDYSGSTDFALFDRQMAEYAPLMIVGQPVLVTGRFKVNKRGDIRYNAERVQDLRALKGKLFRGILLRIDPSKVAALDSILTEFQPAKDGEGVAVSISVSDSTLRRSVTFEGPVRVKLNRQLLSELESQSIAYKILKSNNIQ